MEQKNNNNTSKFQKLAEELNARFPEREQAISAIVAALVASENVFLLGPPGTAKSSLCGALAQAISGRYFSWLLTKHTSPEELFGPLSFPLLKEGRYERVTAHKLPEADVAFLDEIFKGSSAILNTLLPILNEKVFFDGTTPKRIPLRMVLGASNEIPTSPELAALYDRFAVRIHVEPITKASSFEQILSGASLKAVETVITDSDLSAAREEALTIPLSDDVVQAMFSLRQEFSGGDIYVSDRRWVQAARLLKAVAYLNGDNQVGIGHLNILSDVLWTDPDQRPAIAVAIGKVVQSGKETLLMAQQAMGQIREDFKAIMGMPSKDLGPDNIFKISTAIRNARGTIEPFTTQGLKSNREQCVKLVEELDDIQKQLQKKVSQP